jgi:polyvinyl alcohol dehydrogenase (cytochrome)
MFASGGFAAGAQNSSSGAQWLVAGQNVSNTRSQLSESIINAQNAGTLTPLWMFSTGADVSATPTVTATHVYFPDWAGNLYAVDRLTGQQVWSRTIESYVGVAGDLSRVSPAVYNDELIFGDNQTNLGSHNGAHLIAVNRYSGELLWVTQIESHPSAIVTGSAVVYNGVAYQGVSSNEEGLADHPGYPCCTFRGSMVAVDATTGRVLWQTYDMPDNQGSTGQYSGGAIWQPPVIDPGRNLIYAGTGNNYTAPASVLACQSSNPNATNCAAANDFFDSALGLNLATGAIAWTRRLWGYDVYTLACAHPDTGVTCAQPEGLDYDLGSGPNLLNGLVGFGQKSGVYWGLTPSTGAAKWGTAVGPGNHGGGIVWGTATDGTRIYVAIADNGHAAYTLTSGQTITWGSWSALDPSTGKILWQTADPTQGALDSGSLSVANGVLYAGSLSGQVFALDAATGKILWTYASGGSVIDGPSIVDGVVYWGSGYKRAGTGNNKVYAFSLPNAGQAALPSFNPPGGTFAGPLKAVIETASPGATIYYTTDGTLPSASSTKYTAPVPISQPTTTIKAIAVGSGSAQSAVATTAFSIVPAAIATTVSLQSSLNPSVEGQAVTFTATVSAASGPTPVGSVIFKHGGTALGSVPLTGGVATFTTPALAADLYNFIAVYPGNATEASSNSPTVAQRVKAP